MNKDEDFSFSNDNNPTNSTKFDLLSSTSVSRSGSKDRNISLLSENDYEDSHLIGTPQTILGHISDSSGKLYLVKLHGKSYYEVKWLKAKDLSCVSNMLRNYEKHNTMPKDPPYFPEKYFIPEKIIGQKTVGLVRYYLTKWTDLDYNEATWEEEGRFSQYPDLLEIYLKTSTLPPKSEITIPPHPSVSEWKAIKAEEFSESKSKFVIRSYQIDGVNFLMNSWFKRRNAILADEMGLGKTLQSLVFLQQLAIRQKVWGPFFIVAPLSTLTNWEREAKEWTDLRCVTFCGNRIKRSLIAQHEIFYTGTTIPKIQILFTTYEFAMKDAEFFQQIEWQVIVVDEAHRLKNNESKLFYTLMSLKPKFKVLLTGTPLQNNIGELWSLLHFLNDEEFSDLDEFKEKYGKLSEADQIADLHHILKPLMMRRLKGDVEKSIAPFEEIIIECSMTQHQKGYYTSIYQHNMEYLTRGEHKVNQVNLNNICMELRKCCNHPFLINGAEEQIIIERRAALQSQSQANSRNCSQPSLALLSKPSSISTSSSSSLLAPSSSQLKSLSQSSSTPSITSSFSVVSSFEDQKDFAIDCLVKSSGKMILLDKLLTKLKKDGHRVLIFSQMIKMLDIIQEYLIYCGISFQRLDGGIRGDGRQKAIDEFNDPNSEDFVFLLCTKAGGVGINLTSADTVIIYDSDWNPQNDIQATARCHRIGQTKDVKVYRLLTANSYERSVFDCASQKLGLDTAVLGSVSDFSDCSDNNNSDSNDNNNNENCNYNSKNRNNNNNCNNSNNSNNNKQTEQIEKMLRLGAYYAMHEETSDEKISEEDIDYILKRSQTIRHSHAGSCNGEGSTFSKLLFEAETDKDLNLTAPEFWMKYSMMLPASPTSQESQTRERSRSKLRASLKEDSDEGSACQWDRRDLEQLLETILCYGYGRWKVIYDKVKLETSLNEVRLVSKIILKGLIKSEQSETYASLFGIKGCDFDNVPSNAVGSGGKQLNGQKAEKEFEEEFISKHASDLKKITKVGSAWKLSRLELLHYLNAMIEKCPCPPIDILVPEVSLHVPTEWWTEADDKKLLFCVWKNGFKKYDTILFSSKKDLSESLLTLRFKSLVHALKHIYIKFKDLEKKDAPLKYNIFVEAMTIWTSREQQLVIDQLIKNGANQLHDTYTSTGIIMKNYQRFKEFALHIIDTCKAISGERPIPKQYQLPTQIPQSTAIKVVTHIEIMRELRNMSDFPDTLSAEDISILTYVKNNGFSNFRNSTEIRNKFGEKRLSFKVFNFMKNALNYTPLNNPTFSEDEKYEDNDCNDNENGDNDENKENDDNDEEGESLKNQLPLMIKSSLRIICLGKVITDRPGFHNEKYIYPSGFVSEHLYSSLSNPLERIWYRSLIVDDGRDFPIFRVELADDPSIYFEGNVPSKPWMCLVQAIMEKRKKLKMTINRSTAISGPAFYGLSLPLVMKMIRKLPGANLIPHINRSSPYIEIGHDVEKHKKIIERKKDRKQRTSMAMIKKDSNDKEHVDNKSHFSSLSSSSAIVSSPTSKTSTRPSSPTQSSQYPFSTQSFIERIKGHSSQLSTALFDPNEGIPEYLKTAKRVKKITINFGKLKKEDIDAINPPNSFSIPLNRNSYGDINPPTF